MKYKIGDWVTVTSCLPIFGNPKLMESALKKCVGRTVPVKEIIGEEHVILPLKYRAEGYTLWNYSEIRLATEEEKKEAMPKYIAEQI